MPGFKIGGSSGQELTPGKNLDWFREHRYKLIQLLSIRSIDFTNNGELLALKEVKLPAKSIADLSIETPATTYKFSKSASYSDLSLTFYGSRRMLEIIMALQDTAHNVRSGVGDFNEYKDIVEFLIYDKYGTRSGSSQLTNPLTSPLEGIVYRFHNAWISDVDNGSLTYSSSEIKTISCTIKFDFYDVLIDDKLVEGSLSGNPKSTLETRNK